MKVKICGLTNQPDAGFCAEAGADLAGFIFHPQSPRYISPVEAGNIDTLSTLRVGVFGPQAKVSEVKDIFKKARLNLVQLHGGQDKNFCLEIGPKRVIKVLWPMRYETKEKLADDLKIFEEAAAYFLFDAGLSGGGHGVGFDPGFLKNLKIPLPWLWAGGLMPESPANLPLSELFGLKGFDFNSGVEKAPGQKDHRLVKAAIEAVARLKNISGTFNSSLGD